MGTRTHKARAPKRLRIGVLSVSSTRTLAEDRSGQWMVKNAQKEGHEVVAHRTALDDIELIRQAAQGILQEQAPHILLVTGGTGISPADVTIESLQPLFRKELTAFGVLFAQLSYEEIDSAALVSRATAGIIGSTVVFCLPGSLKACKLACQALIFPEAGHLAGHLTEGA